MVVKHYKKMKILHILYELKFSGAEIMYTDAAPVFQKLGCELSVINTAPQLGEFASHFQETGYKVYHWPYPKSYAKRWQYYKKVIRFLKEEHFDVVHIHSTTLKWGMSYCAWKAGCKAVYTFHNVFRSHWYSYPYHWWLRWSARHIFHCTFQTISDSVYDNEKKYYHNDTVKIYNWYGSNRFYPATAQERLNARKELNIPSNTLVIISVGGCSPIKRHTDVLKAIPEILESHPNLIYLHLGEGVSLDEEKKLADSLGINNHVFFCGNQDDVRKYLIVSDIYVMPSRHEGIPITTIEAMGCKIPSILYNVPGLRDFNKEKKCAILIPEDYHILAKTVIELYQNKELQKQLTKNAKDFVDANFYMETNVNKIYKLYEPKECFNIHNSPRI